MMDRPPHPNELTECFLTISCRNTQTLSNCDVPAYMLPSLQPQTSPVNTNPPHEVVASSRGGGGGGGGLSSSDSPPLSSLRLFGGALVLLPPDRMLLGNIDQPSQHQGHEPLHFSNRNRPSGRHEPR